MLDKSESENHNGWFLFVKIPPVQIVVSEKEAKPLRHNQFSLLVRQADRGGNNGQLEWKWNLGHERAPPFWQKVT